ncbi:MAG TPA: AAA family ATPase [Pyrinomonadaceae bacterium]|jgi:transcription initiation factor IIE alpha subunit|nr:AAA family ATPase [Pyrinomonadaceae bacterium]
MKVSKAKLKHFRSHRHTVLQFERVNFLRGLNKSGKSSVAQAIEMALSGRCSLTDEGGRGWEQLIEEGAQTATIVLECPAFTVTLTLDRTVGRTFKVELPGTTILGKQAQDWLAEKIAPPDVINAALNAWRFIRMDEKDQASLLARVLLPAKLELSQEVSDWLGANRLSVVERPTLFATIEATHKAISFARTEVNRKLRDLKAIVEPDEVTGSRDAVKAKLGDLQAQQTEANRKLLALSTRETADRMTADQKLMYERDIDARTKVLTELPPLLSAKAVEKLEAAARLGVRHAEVRALLAAERLALTSAEQDVEKLSKDDETGVCPTCKATLTEASRKAMFAPYMSRLNDVHATIKRLEKELKDTSDSEEAAAQLAAHKNEVRRREELRETLEQLRERHATLFAVREREPLDFTETAEQLQTELEALKQRIIRGLDVLVKMVEAEEAVKLYKSQMAERQKAEARLSELEKLLDYFGPSGIKAKLIAERLSLFTERVNAVLQWWGYSLSFTIEPYSLRITEADTPHISLTPNQLSESESYRLGIAFAVAIAQWTGLRFLIADAADILDKYDKWNLAQALLESDLDQAIVTSTGIAPVFEAEGTAFYTLSKTGGITATELDAQTSLATTSV